MNSNFIKAFITKLPKDWFAMKVKINITDSKKYIKRDEKGDEYLTIMINQSKEGKYYAVDYFDKDVEEYNAWKNKKNGNSGTTPKLYDSAPKPKQVVFALEDQEDDLPF
jgi:hypothetical protein